ncbi:hypothetical protein HY489_01770 [Candidatus Woesearchaeota archaeon]|nr:hypothetical protein [Candidatus Woesearchaeota archaeon]
MRWLLLLLVACSIPVENAVPVDVPVESSPLEPVQELVLPQDPPLPEKSGLQSKRFVWKFNRKEYSVQVPLFQSLEDYYREVPRVVWYYGGKPADIEERIYQKVLDINNTDGFEKLFEFFNKTKAEKGLSDDDLAELIISFVQNIPYDYESVEDPNRQLKYPYQTLFEQKGVCSDKTLVAAKLLHHFGFGVALFLFDNELHMSLGVQCPKASSSYLSGYCYVETTAAESVGVAPELLAGNLSLQSQPRIIPVSTGKLYSRAENNLKKEVKRREFCRQLDSTVSTLKEKEAKMKDLQSVYERSQSPKDYADYRDAYTDYRRFFEEYKRVSAGCKGYEYSPGGFY